MTQQTPDTISHDFHRYGLDGLGLNRAAERRAVERDRHRVSADLRAPGRPFSVRRWLGMVLITVGSRMAGTMPMPMPDLDTEIAYWQVGA